MKSFGAGLLVLAAGAAVSGFSATPSVRDVFADPPREARVQMWYHWISDCITEEGLVRDFKAMGEADVGTAHIFAPSMANLPVKAKPMSEEWLRLFAVAIREAKKNDITLGFHNCPGWSSSGGPWITPENSMKRVVCASADVPADGKTVLKVPQPETRMDFYRDLVAYAFPFPENGPLPLLEKVTRCNSETSAFEVLPVRDPSEKGIDPARICDVSRFLAADGAFDVAAARAAKALPACGVGERCRIVRIGCTTTGKGPAPATIKGLECDKLDRRGIETHWAAMPAKILALPG